MAHAAPAPSAGWEGRGVVLDVSQRWQVIEGDCLAVLPTLAPGSVDAVVTDPPYGTDVPRDGYGRRQLWDATRRIAGDSDLSTMLAGLTAARRVLKPDAWAVCFASPKRHAETVAAAQEAGYSVEGEVVWDKAMPGLGGGIRYQHEIVLLLASGEPEGLSELFSVQRVCRVAAAVHPHEKPTALMRRLVRYVCAKGGTVLDPFAGSGSTGVAAVAEGSRFVGIEREPAYVAIARARIAAEAAQAVLPLGESNA